MTAKKAFTIGFSGNVIEWYNFSVYTFLAVTMGKVFFAENDPKIALLKALFVFSASYLARPIGSLFFGSIGDKRGRAYSLKLSLFLMGVPTILIGLLPTYQSVGITAPILLIIFRLIQGFAAGGELPSSACYMYEISNDRNKNFYCSLTSASSFLGVLCGSLVATISLFVFSENQLAAWAWRIPFLIGSIIVLFLYFARHQLTDDNFSAKVHNPIYKLFAKEYKTIIKISMLHVFTSVSFYLLFVWMPWYLKIYLNYAQKQAFLASSAGLCFLIVFTLLCGYLSSKFNIARRKLMLFSVLTTIVIVCPLFLLLQYKSLVLTYAILFVFAANLSIFDGVIMAVINDSFPKEIRCSGISVSFTFSTAIFGGLVPTVCSYLINKTNWILSPVFFLIAACLIALPAVLSLKKTNS